MWQFSDSMRDAGGLGVVEGRDPRVLALKRILLWPVLLSEAIIIRELSDPASPTWEKFLCRYTSTSVASAATNLSC